MGSVEGGDASCTDPTPSRTLGEHNMSITEHNRSITETVMIPNCRRWGCGLVRLPEEVRSSIVAW